MNLILFVVLVLLILFSSLLRPNVNINKLFKALIFETVFDLHKGVIVYVACSDGEIKKGDRITSYFTKKSYEVQEVGLARPDFCPSNKLYKYLNNL